MNLDFSFYNWDLISNFVLKGLYFSLMLTLVATIGGVLFGTVLALMRLSGRKWLDVPATIYVNGMRSIPLVMVILWFFLLMPAIIGRPIGAECRRWSPSSRSRPRTSAKSCARVSSPFRVGRCMPGRRWA
jgi:glutamate/aspartate transport system permease protein